MDIFKSFAYFNSHYLKLVWIVGIVFLFIILIGKFIENRNDKKFYEKQLRNKINLKDKN